MPIEAVLMTRQVELMCSRGNILAKHSGAKWCNTLQTAARCSERRNWRRQGRCGYAVREASGGYQWQPWRASLSSAKINSCPVLKSSNASKSAYALAIISAGISNVFVCRGGESNGDIVK